MIKNINYHIREINIRTKFLISISVVLFFIIIFNIFGIQILSGEHYNRVALDNRTRHTYILPERGLIYDRNNNLIVYNETHFKPYVLLNDISGYSGNYKKRRLAFLDFLKNVENLSSVNLDYIDVDSVLKNNGFEYLDIFNSEHYQKILKIQGLDGLVIKTNAKRKYSLGEEMFFPIGYVGLSSKNDLSEYVDIDLKMNNIIGKQGLEKYYNRLLHGENGVKESLISASGREIKSFIKKQPKSGNSIVLSIDSNLQKYAYDLLGDNNGVVVVSNVNTGEVLTYVSKPSANSNDFINGISKEKYDYILKSKDNIMLDRVAMGLYPPASTIKQYVAYAGLLGGFITADEKMKTSGTYTINGSHFRDWVRWGHGEVDLKRSLSRSVDYYYYKIGHNMGINFMHDVLSLFGFGKKVNFPEIVQSVGILPSDYWKMKKYGEPFYAGEIVNVAIGQGQILSTPIQMLNAISIMVNNGVIMDFTFLKRDYPKIIDQVELDSSYLDVIKDGLYNAVNDKDGTARAVRDYTDVKVAGKTGTAQVFSTRGEVDYENEEVEKELRDHALFVGFAPFDKPEIAIVVVVENSGGGGSVAAPIAGQVIDYYFNKEKWWKK